MYQKISREYAGGEAFHKNINNKSLSSRMVVFHEDLY